AILRLRRYVSPLGGEAAENVVVAFGGLCRYASRIRPSGSPFEGRVSCARSVRSSIALSSNDNGPSR
ncbi:hypothetical protein ACWF82_34040, partial [Nocardia sp. NPDC055053]